MHRRSLTSAAGRRSRKRTLLRSLAARSRSSRNSPFPQMTNTTFDRSRRRRAASTNVCSPCFRFRVPEKEAHECLRVDLQRFAKGRRPSRDASWPQVDPVRKEFAAARIDALADEPFSHARGDRGNHIETAQKEALRALHQVAQRTSFEETQFECGIHLQILNVQPSLCPRQSRSEPACRSAEQGRSDNDDNIRSPEHEPEQHRQARGSEARHRHESLEPRSTDAAARSDIETPSGLFSAPPLRSDLRSLEKTTADSTEGAQTTVTSWPRISSPSANSPEYLPMPVSSGAKFMLSKTILIGANAGSRSACGQAHESPHGNRCRGRSSDQRDLEVRPKESSLEASRDH